MSQIPDLIDILDDDDDDDIILSALPSVIIDLVRVEKRKCEMIAFVMWDSLESQFTSDPLKRKANVHRDRSYCVNFIHSWDEIMFKRQFRLSPADFTYVLDLISVGFIDNSEYGRRSSGTEITVELKLFITLRILAGACYLDMVWYGVSVDSVHKIVMEIVNRINLKLNNISLPRSKEEFEELRKGWANISIRKKGHDLLPGTILAGDGIAIEIKAPSAKEALPLTVNNYRNRKGFYALITQAFCDCFGRFRYIETSWPGGTNDITAYVQTVLYRYFVDGVIDSVYHMVLDEAYSSISQK